MTIDVTNFLSNGIVPVSFTQNLEMPPHYNILNNSVTVDVLGNLTKENEIFYFKGNVKSIVNFSCDLCLTTVVNNIEFDINERFSQVLTDDEEIWNFVGKTIDFIPAVLSNVLLNLPVKVLCKDDCKGLCESCGKDLNFTVCGCDKSDVDPRWEGLRSLLNKKEV